MKTVLHVLLAILVTLAIHIIAVLIITIARREIWVYKNRNERDAITNRFLWKLAHS